MGTYLVALPPASWLSSPPREPVRRAFFRGWSAPGPQISSSSLAAVAGTVHINICWLRRSVTLQWKPTFGDLALGGFGRHVEVDGGVQPGSANVALVWRCNEAVESRDNSFEWNCIDKTMNSVESLRPGRRWRGEQIETRANGKEVFWVSKCGLRSCPFELPGTRALHLVLRTPLLAQLHLSMISMYSTHGDLFAHTSLQCNGLSLGRFAGPRKRHEMYKLQVRDFIQA